MIEKRSLLAFCHYVAKFILFRLNCVWIKNGFKPGLVPDHGVFNYIFRVKTCTL